MKDRISELKYRNLEKTQVDEERELRCKKRRRKFYKNYLTLLGRATLGNGISEEEEREKGAESLSKEIIAENFPNLEKKIGVPLYEANRTPNCLNTKRSSLGHIILKLSKVNDKIGILRTAREKKDAHLQRNPH